VLSMLKIDTWTVDRVVSWISGQYDHVCDVTTRLRSICDGERVVVTGQIS